MFGLYASLSVNGYIFNFFFHSTQGEKRNSDDSLHKCSIWGPACSDDKIVGDLYLPKLNVGDWLYYEDMGAYTLSLNSGFNGFPKPVTYYFIKESYM